MIDFHLFFVIIKLDIKGDIMIYVVRHGQTDWNIEGRTQGHSDIPLNQKGINQAKEMSLKLRDIKFDKVFSSPLKRAYEIASVITNNPIIKDNRLIERYGGTLEGTLAKDNPKDIRYNDPNENRYGIENILDFRKRIFDFFDEITTNYTNENILVVTHAGVSIYAKVYFEGEPIDNDYEALKLKNCEVFVYENNKIKGDRYARRNKI